MSKCPEVPGTTTWIDRTRLIPFNVTEELVHGRSQRSRGILLAPLLLLKKRFFRGIPAATCSSHDCQSVHHVVSRAPFFPTSIVRARSSKCTSPTCFNGSSPPWCAFNHIVLRYQRPSALSCSRAPQRRTLELHQERKGLATASRQRL